MKLDFKGIVEKVIAGLLVAGIISGLSYLYEHREGALLVASSKFNQFTDAMSSTSEVKYNIMLAVLASFFIAISPKIFSSKEGGNDTSKLSFRRLFTLGLVGTLALLYFDITIVSRVIVWITAAWILATLMMLLVMFVLILILFIVSPSSIKDSRGEIKLDPFKQYIVIPSVVLALILTAYFSYHHLSI